MREQPIVYGEQPFNIGLRWPWGAGFRGSRVFAYCLIRVFPRRGRGAQRATGHSGIPSEIGERDHEGTIADT